MERFNALIAEQDAYRDKIRALKQIQAGERDKLEDEQLRQRKELFKNFPKLPTLSYGVHRGTIINIVHGYIYIDVNSTLYVIKVPEMRRNIALYVYHGLIDQLKIDTSGVVKTYDERFPECINKEVYVGVYKGGGITFREKSIIYLLNEIN